MGGGAIVSSGGSASSAYPYQVTTMLVLGAITASFGGLMFGYEIGIAGGAIGMDAFLKKFFWSIYDKRQHASVSQFCKFDEAKYQVIVSSLFLVGAFVSLISSPLQRKIGRKLVMLISSLFFLGGCAMLAFAQNVATVIFGRVMWGFCMGLANSSVPVYLSEIAPSNLRGTLNILFQLCTTIGIWCANLINWALVNTYHTPDYAWRISFGCAVVPGCMMLIGTILLPNTPQSSLELGKRDAAYNTLHRLRGDAVDIEAEFKSMVADHERVRLSTPSWGAQLRLLTTRPYLPSLFIIIVMPFLQQFTGINAIQFYSNQLFETVGIDNPFQTTMIVNSINCLMTFPAIWLADKVGRRTLLIEGAVQMTVSHVFMCWLIATGWTATSKSGAGMAIFFMCFFIAAFSWSWGPVCWLVPTEIVPLEVRSLGMSIATWSNFLFSFVIGQWYLTMQCHMESGVYLWWSWWCVVALMFTIFLLPETKGVSLENITKMMKAHPLWSRCYSPSGITGESGASLELTHSSGSPASQINSFGLQTPLHKNLEPNGQTPYQDLDRSPSGTCAPNGSPAPTGMCTPLTNQQSINNISLGNGATMQSLPEVAVVNIHQG